MTNNLPPMPVPAVQIPGRHEVCCARFDPTPSACDCRTGYEPGFTLSQLQADRLAVWNAAIQQAAQIAQETSKFEAYAAGSSVQDRIASAIRLLEETN